jgi:hypothetical protein
MGDVISIGFRTSLGVGDVVAIPEWGPGYWIVIDIGKTGYHVAPCDENGDLIIEDDDGKEIHY